MPARMLSVAAVALAATAAAAVGVGDVQLHDHHGSADTRLMRKEVTAQPAVDDPAFSAVIRAVIQDLAAEPPGYYNRGQDCPGGQTSDTSGTALFPLFMENTAVPDCAGHCSKTTGCKGFTFSRVSKTCYFKDFACNSTVKNGWEFYQQETCDYKLDACEAAVASNPLLTKASPFVVTGDITGCYTYTSGVNKTIAFYGQRDGRDIRVAQELTTLVLPLQRVAGYGCEKDGTLTLQLGGRRASLLDMDEEIVLEDELERAAGLSDDELQAEAIAHRFPAGTPARVELLRPEAAASPAILAAAAGQEVDEALVVEPEEDEEDRRRFPALAPRS